MHTVSVCSLCSLPLSQSLENGLSAWGSVTQGHTLAILSLAEQVLGCQAALWLPMLQMLPTPILDFSLLTSKRYLVQKTKNSL